MARFDPQLILFGAVLGAGAAGCAPLTNVKPTMETAQSVSLSNTELFSAALGYAQQQHWSIAASDQGLGLVEALTAVDASQEMTTRERWIIWTRNREIAIQLRLEFLEQGQWRSVDLVCDSYSYFRENQHLAGIADQARTSIAAKAFRTPAPAPGTLVTGTPNLSFNP